jgi:hypothetical protein
MTSPSKKDSVTVEESILLLEGALSSVTSLLIVVLSKQFSSGNLYSIFKHLSPWIQSSDDQERNRGVLCFLDLMKGYQLNSDTDEFRIYSETLPASDTLLLGRWRYRESCWEEWFLAALTHPLTRDWLPLTVSR